ncbi:hypothetical protein [Pseudidiomarina gelatinasegens]|tara:strand:+ start:4135 stop:4266 length:132 start_codon:yes stop_codon:yes gene_type:complete
MKYTHSELKQMAIRGIQIMTEISEKLAELEKKHKAAASMKSVA